MDHRKEKTNQEVEKTMDLLGSAAKMTAPTGFANRMMQLIEAEKFKTKQSIRREIVKIAAIVIFVIANTTLLFTDSSASDGRENSQSSAETLIVEYGLEQQSYLW